MEFVRGVLVSLTGEMPVIEGELVTAIRTLADRGVGKKTIAREVGVAVNMVRRYLVSRSRRASRFGGATADGRVAVRRSRRSMLGRRPAMRWPSSECWPSVGPHSLCGRLIQAFAAQESSGFAKAKRRISDDSKAWRLRYRVDASRWQWLRDSADAGCHRDARCEPSDCDTHRTGSHVAQPTLCPGRGGS